LRAREHIALVEEEQSASRRLTLQLAAATAFAALTALGARVQFYLPFTPVPLTGQVFCVLLAGAVLGPRLGFISQVQYLAAGAVGLPVFAHGGGPAALLGPTGGYLIGFPLAAAVAGTLYGRVGSWSWLAFPACLSGVVVIYIFGAAWYVVWIAALGGAVALPVVLAQSVFPFVPVDAAKAALVAGAAPWLRRRLPFR
jgi:biotin transport system substrate-specific component